MAENNLVISVAAVLTEVTQTVTVEWAELLKLQIPKHKQFFNIQSNLKYVIHVTEEIYCEQHTEKRKKRVKMPDVKPQIYSNCIEIAFIIVFLLLLLLFILFHLILVSFFRGYSRKASGSLE